MKILSRTQVPLASVGGLALTAALTFTAATLHAQPGPAVLRLPTPAAATTPPTSASTETAVLAGGCFWGVQGVFAHVKGVQSVVSGYSGGEAATADYETVSTGTTGHAESVKIVFDPRQVSYGEILRIFFSVATDPTQLDRQFPDEGTQYRSEVFYTTPQQESEATAYIAQLGRAKAFAHPIVTRIDPLKAFFPAEAYHQDYLTLHQDAPYIATFDLPKVAALKTLFPEDYRDAPVLVMAQG
jgi:peptide-methionine (S)-S-oxide reductase